MLDRFLDRGWNVCATHRGEAGDLPGGVLAVEADLTDPASAEAVVAATLERFGSVDGLGCVAGGFRLSGPLHESSPDDWRCQLAVNLDTAYTITRAALAADARGGVGLDRLRRLARRPAPVRRGRPLHRLQGGRCWR